MYRKNSLKRYLLLGWFLLFLLSFTGCKNNKDRFLDALLANDWKTAQTILDRNSNLVHTRLESGGTLLHAAVYYDNKEMLEFLLKNGADVNIDSKEHGETPLHDAASQSRLMMASILLQNEADVNARDGLQCTPLHDAAMYSNKEMVKLLISHGAIVDAKRDFNDRTPLYYACVNRDENQDALEVVETLLLNGADPNAKCSSDGTSIIQSTIVHPNCYFKKAQLLEDFGAKLEIDTDEGTKVFKVKEAQEIYEQNHDYIQKHYEEINKEYLKTD